MLYFKECGINAAKILSAECLDILILALFIMFHLHGILGNSCTAMQANSSFSEGPHGHWDIDDASCCDFCMDMFTQL